MFKAVTPHLSVASLLLLSIALIQAMADALDPDISNGTCYYANDRLAPSRYIPCGNEALGHKSCCESQDMCLSSNACYNGQYGVTYLAGCTDPDYQDSSCPGKGNYTDQTWAGLVYCNGSSNEWVACKDSGQTVSVPAPCWCPATSRTVAFTDASKLTNIMSLPTATGLSVTWKDVSAYASQHSLTSTFGPSVAVSFTSTNSSVLTVFSQVSGSSITSAMTRSTSTTFPSATITPLSSETSVSGLTTGQKIGIAIGSAGTLIAILLFGWLLLRCARHRKRESSTPPVANLTGPQSEITQHDPDLRSPTWSGHKSELPADESTSAFPAPAYQAYQRPQSAEVEGSPVRISPSRPTHDGGYMVSGHKETCYELAG